MRIVAIVAGWLGLITGNLSLAYQIEDVRIEWWTGAGDNSVLLVVDFWPENGEADSFAFGCRFSGPQMTGQELLDALQAANGGFSYAHSGGFVTDMWYVTGGVTYHTGYNWPDSWWSYWLSTDFGETWEFAMVGPADRILLPGDTDGWLAKPESSTADPVTPLGRGDVNCDGAINAFDIDPFVLALTDPGGYHAAFPACRIERADMNADGVIDSFDIDPFVALLAG